MRRIMLGLLVWGWIVLGVSPPSYAVFECFGPYTLTSSGVATPVPTPAATPTTGAWPTVAPKPVHAYTQHAFFASFTDTGDNLDAAPYVVFYGVGPGGVTTQLLTVKATAGTTIPGPSPTPNPTFPQNGPAMVVQDHPLRGIYPELHGCINCSVSVSWCSSD